MDLLNEYIHVHPPNPLNRGLSESDISDNEMYVDKLQELNRNKIKKHEYEYGDWCMIHSSDLWNLWCLIYDFKKNGSNLLSKMNFAKFCDMCYNNSRKT